MVREYNRMMLESPEFEDGDELSDDYTCEGSGRSPPFKISGVPSDAQSLVLIMEDKNSYEEGSTTHWLVWNIPTNVARIEENILPEGAKEGKNDLGAEFYAPPCPDMGDHKYRIVLYALDKKLDLPSSTTRADLEEEILGSILAEDSMEVVYKRYDEVEEDFDIEEEGEEEI